MRMKSMKSLSIKFLSNRCKFGIIVVFQNCLNILLGEEPNRKPLDKNLSEPLCQIKMSFSWESFLIGKPWGFLIVFCNFYQKGDLVELKNVCVNWICLLSVFLSYNFYISWSWLPFIQIYIKDWLSIILNNF